jgi:hypothetical protein
MGRPRKLENDDRYSEESLNLQEGDTREARYDSDGDEMLVELGDTNRRNSFERLTDAVSFGDGGY